MLQVLVPKIISEPGEVIPKFSSLLDTLNDVSKTLAENEYRLAEVRDLKLIGKMLMAIFNSKCPLRPLDVKPYALARRFFDRLNQLTTFLNDEKNSLHSSFAQLPAINIRSSDASTKYDISDDSDEYQADHARDTISLFTDLYDHSRSIEASLSDGSYYIENNVRKFHRGRVDLAGSVLTLAAKM